MDKEPSFGADRDLPPGPIDWNLLDAPTAAIEWRDLDVFVTWLKSTFGLPPAAVLPYWHRHDELIWELSALHAQDGILGVLQAEHDLLVRLKSLPTAMNLRLIVDSQQRLSQGLAALTERTDARRADSWRTRAASYTLVKRYLRNVGGHIGTGGLAVAEAATACSQLRALPADTIVHPRIAAGFQTLFNGVDQRIAEIMETGIDRNAYLTRVQLPQLIADSGKLVAPWPSSSRRSTATRGQSSSMPCATSFPASNPWRLHRRAAAALTCTQHSSIASTAATARRLQVCDNDRCRRMDTATAEMRTPATQDARNRHARTI